MMGAKADALKMRGWPLAIKAPQAFRETHRTATWGDVLECTQDSFERELNKLGRAASWKNHGLYVFESRFGKKVRKYVSVGPPEPGASLIVEDYVRGAIPAPGPLARLQRARRAGMAADEGADIKELDFEGPGGDQASDGRGVVPETPSETRSRAQERALGPSGTRGASPVSPPRPDCEIRVDHGGRGDAPGVDEHERPPCFTLILRSRRSGST